MRLSVAKTLGVAGLALAAIAPAMAMAKTFIYVSNAADGDISTFELAPNTGKLTAGPRIPAGPGVAPLTVSPDRRYLYAAVRGKPYKVITFEIDKANGQLKHISEAPLADSFPYISLDRTGRYLFGVSYDGDIVTVNAVDRHGKVAEQPLQTLKTSQNAHSIRVDNSNKFVFVPNLGGERVLQYTFDANTGKLTPNDPPSVTTASGTGPRHVVVAPDNKYVYVLNELLATVTSYALDQKTGLLRIVSTADSMQPGSKLVPGAPRGPMRTKNPGMRPHDNTSHDIWAADIHLTTDNRFLYTSERTSSTLAAFKVDLREGSLGYIGSYPTEKQPRGFAITPDNKYLLATGELSPTLSLYKIDSHSGELALDAKYPVGGGANWVEVVKF
jgi:6-phosphogluconolactonase